MSLQQTVILFCVSLLTYQVISSVKLILEVVNNMNITSKNYRSITEHNNEPFGAPGGTFIVLQSYVSIKKAISGMCIRLSLAIY